jgi:hypothetical protein
MPSLVLANLVDGYDVGMPQICHGGSLLFETRDGVVAREDAMQQHLDSDFAAKAQLPGAINDSHAAARNFVEQLVVSNAPFALAQR